MLDVGFCNFHSPFALKFKRKYPLISPAPRLRMKSTQLHLLLLPALLLPRLAPAQTWTQTMAPVKAWQTVASSADGSKLVAAGPAGGIYTSPDYGVTWVSNSTPPPPQTWLSLVSSADGTKLAAIPFNITPLTSTNSGAHWVTNTPFPNDWHHLASSADGNTLFGAGSDGVITISTNGGGSWVKSSNAPTALWGCIACSADGTKVVAMIPPGLASAAVYTSTNGGLNWATNNAPMLNRNWESVSSSADGNILAAAWGGSSIFVSTNAGGSWSSNAVPGEALSSIASSADGTKLVAVGGVSPHVIVTSTDSGVTWSTNIFAHAGNWTSVASSADGNSLVAVASTGGIWTLRNVTPPQLNLSSSADGNLDLSWTIPSTNFVLQQSPDLVSWTDVTNAPALNLSNLQNEVFLPPTNTTFFRLQSQ